MPKPTIASLIQSGQITVTKEEGREYHDDTRGWLSRHGRPLPMREAVAEGPPKWLKPVCVRNMTEKQRDRELAKFLTRWKDGHEGLQAHEIVLELPLVA